ncbi:MAG: YraN family protein [Myxococcota bacterium]
MGRFKCSLHAGHETTGMFKSLQRLTARAAKGARGEGKACELLKRLGYKILERNYRLKFGEIDIIAQKDDTICFVEVRSRTDGSFGAPELSVNKRKQSRIIRTAQTYIRKNKIKDMVIRFDIIAVAGEEERVTHYPNAFQSRY